MCVHPCAFSGCFWVWPHLCVCACVPGHACVCICLQTFLYILLGSLICFGSVWWAGHKANYLLKGKSEPNEPHWATEVTGLIKHSVCITGYFIRDPIVCWIFTGLQTYSIISTRILHIYRVHKHTHAQIVFFTLKQILSGEWLRAVILYSESWGATEAEGW